MTDPKNQIRDALAHLGDTISKLEDAAGKFKSERENLTGRLDVAEALIADLSKSVVALTKASSDINRSCLIIMRGMEALQQRIENVERVLIRPIPLKEMN